jgi:ABC-type multidrug transport system permease subunit
MGPIVMPMSLSRGTFPPNELALPEWLVTIIPSPPLYHGFHLPRVLSTGLVGIGQLWDLLYLVAFFAICMWLAMRQMERKLIK